MSAARGSLTLAFPIVAGALAPDSAEACPYVYDCESVPSWSTLTLRNAAKIPTDGVLVLEGTRHGEGDPLAGLTIEVTKDGQPIAGALETTPHRHALVWRATEPWEPGASYYVDGTISNPGVNSYCAVEEDIFGGDIFVDMVPSGALAVPEFTGTATQFQALDFSLETIACCVGADPPELAPDYCGGYYINFDTGTCGPTKASGSFSLELISAAVADEPASLEVLYTVKFDGEIRGTSFMPSASFYGITEPACVTLEALDLGTGTMTVSAEQCFGDDFAAELGPQTLVPDLGCPLEQCAVMGMTWDKTMCTPFESGPASDSDTPTSGDSDPGTGESGSESGDTDPDLDDEKGCACNETGAPSALLLVTPLLLAGRRRRT